ncbi:MAG: hypothetical protein K9K79_13410, partial [Desulfohalobiaceae bacterium]|nr:hypothetical protein [Desulfohalobiaceae bacterium]
MNPDRVGVGLFAEDISDHQGVPGILPGPGPKGDCLSLLHAFDLLRSNDLSLFNQIHPGQSVDCQDFKSEFQGMA